MATRAKPKRVAVLGLGRMGGLIAQHLVDEGYAVTAYDPARAALARAKRNGAKTVTSVAAAVRNVEVVCSSLPGPVEVEATYLGEGGALKAMRRGTVVFDHTTSSVDLARTVAGEARKAGIEYLDAPLSGSVPQMTNRTAAAIVAGNRSALRKHQDVLEAFCGSVTYMGKSGNGLVMKLVTNHVLDIFHAGIAEGLAFGSRAGLDPSAMVTFLQGSAAPRLLDYKAPAMAKRDYSETIFNVNLCLKDLGLAAEVAQAAGAVVPVGAAARQQYVTAQALGFGESDFNTVFESYIQASGGKAKRPRSGRR